MDYAKILEEAHAVGRAAAIARIPVPMNIVGRCGTGEVRHYHIPEGACGFAYVTIKPARGPFVAYLKRAGIGHKAYYGGWEFSIFDHGQSVDRKAAHAAAVAKYLTDAGIIGVSSYDRLD